MFAHHHLPGRKILHLAAFDHVADYAR